MKGIIFYFERLWVWVLYFLMLFPLLPKGVESVLMITFFIISLVIWNKKRQVILPRKHIALVFLFSTIFFTYVISLLYTTNLQEGINRIVKVLPIILFPFVFLFLRRDMANSLEFKKLNRVYLTALATGLLFLHIAFFNVLYFSSSTHWQIRQEIEKLTDVHGTYMSMWIGFGVLLLFSELKLGQSKKTFFLITLIGYFIYWQVTIGARVPFVTTLVFGMLFFIVKTRINKRMIVSFLLLAIASLIFLITSKSNLTNRVKKVFSFEQKYPTGDYSKEHKNISSEDIRKGIYFCSWHLAKKSIWYGYGIGDVQDELNACYDEKFNTNTYQIFKFNSHNQYLQVLLSSGILALLLFLIGFLFPLYLSWQHGNYLWFFFTLFIMACCFTENILERHDGVIFFSLFNSLLMLRSLKNKS